MPRARPVSEFEAVRAMVQEGLTSREIAERTGVSYDTVRRWRLRSSPPAGGRRHTVPDDWRPPDAQAYGYLLGLYLGDGCLDIQPQASPRLMITLDARYSAIIAEAKGAIQRTVPGIRVCMHGRGGAVIITAGHPVWPMAFPQHGPGRKHRRKIELADWQLSLTHEDPRPLLRGLLHSDGARCVNAFRVALPSGRIAEYSYDRYFFTNYSADIRRIFCEHCDLVGIHWTRSSFKNISVADRASVAALDEFVGPKT